VKLPTSKRRIAAAAALIMLVLFLLRPGASRLKSRIVSSISSGVGRPVDIGSVHLRLLPRPGFDLQNLVVYDDPAFGAEPMLRASEVTADLRLTSLVRGRLEISRLDLTEPSLNLVHAEGGRWNLEALLERTAHIPLAPTGKAKSEPRPGFPYIEATSARINFKSGPEKKPYALTNADFSLWQDSENSWGVRLKAQPFRTDLNLNDTGLLQVSGTWQRAEALRDTPLQFSLEWNRAQLGQFTKFFTGNDQGWRGEIQLDVTLAGTPAKLQVTSNGSIQDFRRYDITSGQALRLAAHCEGEYSSLNRAVHGVLCSAPVGRGLITLKGNMGLPGSRSYALVLAAENVPASAAALLVERAKKNLPLDLVADGTVRGDLRIDEAADSKLQLEGRGEIADFRLASAANNAEIGPETIPFSITVGDSSGRKRTVRKSAAGMRFPDSPHIEFGPIPVAIGRTSAPTVQGWVDRSAYNFEVAGEADIARALRMARMFGLVALQSAAEGTAQLDLQIAGSWAERSNGTSSGFTGSQVTGTAKLRNVRVAVRGAGGPVEIIAAEMQLLPDEVRVSKLNAKAADTSWTGSLEMPRGCGTPGACQVRFVLNANQIALGGLREWVSPRQQERPWYRVLESTQAGPTFLASLRASGQLTADRLQMQTLVATRVSAKVTLDTGKLQVSDLAADFLGGKHLGQWRADFSVQPALCGGTGSLTRISLARLADAMKDSWITGTANAKYEVKVPCPAEASTSTFWTSLSTSAEGALQFEARDGTLPRVALEEDGVPIRFTSFAGLARLTAGNIEMKDARLDSAGGKFQLSGSALLKGPLDFHLSQNQNGAAPPGYTIGGTLAEPRVIRSPSADTQARLKTDPPKLERAKQKPAK
jgi:AsmA family